MIPQAQFDSIKMTAPTRRVALAEMDAALASVDVWTALSSVVTSFFRSVEGAAQPLPTRG
jgi:hypothetical protein